MSISCLAGLLLGIGQSFVLGRLKLGATQVKQKKIETRKSGLECNDLVPETKRSEFFVHCGMACVITPNLKSPNEVLGQGKRQLV